MNHNSKQQPKKIWVLSSRDFKNADRCYKWTSDLANFTDCDILIIDLTTYPTFKDIPIINQIPGLKGKKVVKAYNTLFSEKKHIAEMMELGRTVICIMMPNQVYYTEYKKVDNFSWLPVYPNTEYLTPGERKNIEDNVFFKEYYTKFVKRYHFEIENFTKSITHKIYDIKDSEVKTPAGQIIGCSLKISDGLFHFLPPPINVNSKYAIDFLINAIRAEENELYNVPPPPTWLQNYISETEKNAIGQREKLLHSASEYKEKIKIYQDINRIVWVCGNINKGKTLENSVKTLFENEFDWVVTKTQSGFSIDLKAVCPKSKRKFAIEITGVKDKIKRSDKKCTQIFQYYSNEKTDEEEKIVFIANTYCNKEIKDRPKDNFSPDAEKVMKSMNVCMITTLQLFNLWKDMEKGKITKEAIVEKIYKTDGIFK